MADYAMIQRQIERLKKATPAAQEAALLLMISQHEQDLLDINRGQLLEGLDADSQPLAAYKNAKYAARKRQLNGNGVTDLRLTGSLHRQMFLSAGRFPVLFDSKDSKATMLKKKYGNIFGIQDELEPVVAEEILGEQIQKYYAELFQL